MSHYPPIQVVDDNDHPVGGASLTEAYDKGLVYRVVYVCVQDQAGNILMQKRGPTMATYPNCWDISSAGHVDEGESYLEAAERELSEEVGISGFPLSEITTYRDDLLYEGELHKRFIRLYRTVTPADTPLTLEPVEVTAIQWLSVEATRQLIKEHPAQVAIGLVQSLEKLFPI